jgi:hypothetical protein
MSHEFILKCEEYECLFAPAGHKNFPGDVGIRIEKFHTIREPGLRRKKSSILGKQVFKQR